MEEWKDGFMFTHEFFFFNHPIFQYSIIPIKLIFPSSMPTTKMPRRVYIETYGCQMNEDDSDRILRLLGDLDYVETKEAEHADLVLINTCSVREKPEHKVYSALGRYKRLKEGRGTIIGVAGCVAQQEGERLLDRVPYLDLVIGTQAIHLLPRMLERIEKKERVCETGADPEGKYLTAPPFRKPLARVKSFVTIMQGCDHFCSFCIVPYVRGREKTRPSREVLDEVRHLAEMGVKEVCLLGQNVNSYGKGVVGELDFSDLLSRINEIEGIRRIRFTTSHPQDLSERVDPGLFKAGQTLRAYPSSFPIRLRPGPETDAPWLHESVLPGEG